MAGRRSFKTDESFLEKLAIGATGTRAVIADVQKQGFRPIELERGSASWKIWKQIKIKRLRVPDVLLLDTATRIEARAKTALEISMSHSESDAARGWDRGLLDGDFVALTLCRKTGQRPIDWQASPNVQYVKVSDMRRTWAQGSVFKERPKGAQEGFELRVTWPAAVSSADGQVTEIAGERLKLKRAADGRTISLHLRRKDVKLSALVSIGDRVFENQIVASVIPVITTLPSAKPADKTTYIRWLASRDVATRYAGAKALAFFAADDVTDVLLRTQDDDQEHVYVRLEAASSLARHGNPKGWQAIADSLESQYLENQLETVIILGELKSQKALKLLVAALLDPRRHAEIRAGAAWAIGEIGQSKGADALIRTFTDLTPGVRIEAVRALRKLMESCCPPVVPQLGVGQPDERAGLAWALSRSGRFTLDELIEVCRKDDEARRWVAYVLGTQDADKWTVQLEPLRESDPEVFFAVTVLWQLLRSWIADVDEF